MYLFKLSISKQNNINILILLLSFMALSCEESLPEYQQPQHVLAMNVELIQPLPDRIAPPGKQKVQIQIKAENIFDEVFLDSVDIQGVVRIWWKRKPHRYSTIYLTEKNLIDRNLVKNGKIQLLPGQSLILQFLWDVRGDNGFYFLGEMDFSRQYQRHCSYNIDCSSPETFEIEASVMIYRKVGTIVVPPRDFDFVGKLCRDPTAPCL